MAFCSQCGFLLPPKAITCPFCDAPITPGSGGGVEGQNANDPTIISALEKTEHSGNAHDVKTDLVQRPAPFATSNSQEQGIEQAHNKANTPGALSIYHTPPPEYFTPTATPIPPPPPDYSVRNNSDFSTTQGGSYPGSFSPMDPGVSNSSPPFLPQKAKGKAWLIALIVSLSIIIGATAIVFVIGPTTVLQVIRGGGTTPQQPPVPSTVQATTPQVPTPTPMLPTPTPMPTPTPKATPQQQAQAVVDSYYTSINNKDYQMAYNLWVNYPDTYQNFANGFATTQHDDYQIGQVIQQSDGTVQVNLTLTATSTSSQQTTYQGYYSVGRQADGSWKIITASMNQA